MHKGYRYEYAVKKKLIDDYGKQNVLKLAIGQSADFIVLAPNQNKVEKIVEVKGTRKEKFYLKPREKIQFENIDKLAKEHNIPIEIWIKTKNNGFEIKRKVIE
ncbi:MAG: hypothetical protein QXM68_00670 [Candidatus Aenigmatarchaeota archaeon]|nr:hypothetical protein [Candidatus Aenigmarchaeota archaeon]